MDSQEFQAIVWILPRQLLINGHVRLCGGKRVKLERIGIAVLIIVGVALCLVGPIVHIRCVPCILIDATAECWLGHARALLLIDSVIIVLRALQIRSQLLILAEARATFTTSTAHDIDLILTKTAEGIVENIAACGLTAPWLRRLVGSSTSLGCKLSNVIENDILGRIHLFTLHIIRIKLADIRRNTKAIVKRVVGHFFTFFRTSIRLVNPFIIITCLVIIRVENTSIGQAVT